MRIFFFVNFGSINHKVDLEDPHGCNFNGSLTLYTPTKFYENSFKTPQAIEFTDKNDDTSLVEVII